MIEEKYLTSFNISPPSSLPSTKDVKVIIDSDCTIVSETGKINDVDMDFSMDQK